MVAGAGQAALNILENDVVFQLEFGETGPK